MTPLSGWTAGLVGDRDPAQPLLTLLDGPARVELSGATAANWVAKSAHLLLDGLGLGGPGQPARVGLLLPLHWQAVCLLLASVTAGCETVLANDADGLAGCDAAFVLDTDAAAALDRGVGDVLALSGHPLGVRCSALPSGVEDYATEVPTHPDRWSGPATTLAAPSWGVALPDGPLALPPVGLGSADRLLCAVSPDRPAVLLAALAAGAAVVLCPRPESVDLAAAVAQEGITAVVGLDVAGLPRLDG